MSDEDRSKFKDDMLKHKLDNNQFAREIWNAAIEKVLSDIAASNSTIEYVEAIRKLKI